MKTDHLRLGFRSYSFAALALLCLAALAMQGQEPQQPVVTFRVGADLVVVDVSVRDRQGKPIQDLTKKDFVLTEDGKPQEVQLFAIEDIISQEFKPPAEITSKLLVPPPKPATGVAPTQPVSAPPPEPVDVRNKRWIVLFFDLTSLPAPDLLRAEKSALQFIDKQMTGGDLVSIVTFENSPKVTQDFTQDRARLKAQLDKLVKEPDSGQLTADAAVEETAADETASDAFVADDTEFNIFNSDRKLAAIETIAQWLAPYPERKALIHYSGGVSTTGTENQAQLRATIAAAGKANISIYPVDARGLVALPSGGDASRGSTGSRSQFNGRAVMNQFSNLSASQDTLWALAEDTGGKAFFDNNDLGPVFAQVREDISHYYVLGYYSNNTSNDGKFRRIKVTVNIPGAGLSHREGYYAPKDFTLLTKAERQRHLEESASLAALSSEFPLALTSGYFRTRGDVNYVPVSLRFPSVNIPFMEKKGMHQTEFDFVAQVRGDKDKLVTFVKDTVRLNLDDPTFKSITQKALQYDTGFYLKPGKYAIKFLVRENQSGKLGVFEESLNIPALPASGLSLSSVMLGSQLQEVQGPPGAVRVVVDDAMREFFRNAGPWSNPLVSENRKLVPSVTRVFRSTDNLYVVFEIYGAAEDPATRKPDVGVSMSVWRGNQKVSQAPPYAIDQFGDPERKVIKCRYQLPLTGFQQGPYTLQIDVIDQAAGQHAHSRSTIAIRP
jgi:VWFA-related protein